MTPGEELMMTFQRLRCSVQVAPFRNWPSFRERLIVRCQQSTQVAERCGFRISIIERRAAVTWLFVEGKEVCNKSSICCLIHGCWPIHHSYVFLVFPLSKPHLPLYTVVRLQERLERKSNRNPKGEFCQSQDNTGPDASMCAHVVGLNMLAYQQP